jgi:hypothetical protein
MGANGTSESGAGPGKERRKGGVLLAGSGCARHHSQAAPAASKSLCWRATNTGEQDIMSFLYLIFLSSSSFLFPLQSVHAQSISTSTPVPPLQWINLSGLFKGPAAPPLKDASIGYDNTSRTLIIFGGESQGGIPQQRTYLCVISSFLAPFPFLKPSYFPQSQPRHPHLVLSIFSRRDVLRVTTPKKCRYRRR